MGDVLGPCTGMTKTETLVFLYKLKSKAEGIRHDLKNQRPGASCEADCMNVDRRIKLVRDLITTIVSSEFLIESYVESQNMNNFISRNAYMDFNKTLSVLAGEAKKCC